MTDRVAHKLNCGKLLLSVAGWLGAAAVALFGLVAAAKNPAQSPTDNKPQGLEGTWQGTLHNGRDYRDVVKISKADNSGYKVVFYLPDQSGDGFTPSNITAEGPTLKMTLPFGSYAGKLSPDGKTITGTWTQGSALLPLIFTRATPETEWTIPPPTPKLPPMDANADPSFEVATIKPSKPDDQRKGFLVHGDQFHIINQPLSAILSFSYNVQAKQLIGLPPWADTDKYDIDAKPDGEGAPSSKQWKVMIQKMVAERFKLTFHREKKELPVYVLSVAKTGPKLTKSEGDPNGLPGLFFRGKLGDLGVRNANMADFTGLMQEAVLDRPVLDQTGLTERFDFTLVWTPDDSQFAGMGAKIPPPTDGANAAPNLYTAIQEQIGLKLEATKAPADVMVIDHVEKPSEN